MAKFATQAVQNQLDVLPVTQDFPDTIRPLGSLEHLFWLIDQRGPIHFAVTAEVSGRTSPRDWRQALDAVQERHTFLSVRVEGSPGSIPQFRQVDAAPIPLRIVEDDPATRWEAEVGEELATPFDPNEAPLVRAVLIQGIEDAAFMLVAHHVVADGVSLAYVMRDTLHALIGGFLARLPVLPSQEDLLGLDHVPPQQESTGEPQCACREPLDLSPTRQCQT
jgi:hypothetical protein